MDEEFENILLRARLNPYTPKSSYVSEIKAIMQKYLPQCLGCGEQFKANYYCAHCTERNNK